MAIIHVLEDLDEGLEITQVLNEDKAAAELPEHDQLFLDKAKEVEDAEKKKEEVEEPAANDSSADPASDTPPGEEDTSPQEGDAEQVTEESEMEVIDGKQTTVATESLRTDDYYSRFALESFGEETLGMKAASMAWSGVKALSGYALHIATELGTYLKEAGIEYGPRVFAKLRSGVSYLVTRVFKSYVKMRSATTRAYFQYNHNFKSHNNRLQRLRQILDGLPDNVKVMKDEPFQDEEVYSLFQVGNQVSVVKSLSSMSTLLDVVVGDIDHGIHNELNVMKQVIEVCERNARVEVLHYLQITGLSSGFMKKTVTGYDKAPDHVETYAFTHNLPKNITLMAAIPRRDVVNQAAQSGDMTEVSRAYQESYMVLGVNPVVSKAIPMVNYMDKKSLLSLLDGLEAIIDKAGKHVSFYKKLEDAAASLKPSFQNYFSWLTEDEKARSLRESLAEVIYLKQSFVTKVYLPCAIDIHDFTSTYVGSMLRYVEKNIKVLKPAEPESAV